MIETGNVDSASSAMEKIASQLSDLSSSVSGYDTSCEDGFDFASAKNVIASNIEACVTKVKNTASILNTVSQTHTQLQSTLKYKEDTSSQNTKKSGSRSSGYSGGGYSSAAAVSSQIFVDCFIMLPPFCATGREYSLRPWRSMPPRPLWLPCSQRTGRWPDRR